MKYTILFIILFCTNSFAKILDQAIVIIEDDVITQSEFEEKLNFLLNQYRLSGNRLPQDISAFQKQILDRMVNTRLQLNYGKRIGVEVEEWMIDKAMENIAKRSGVTLTEFREDIISKGLNYNTYRNELKKDLITREIKRRVLSEKIKVSKKEIDEFVKHKSHVFKENNQYKMSNILVAFSERPSDDEKSRSKKKIEMIQKRFFDGEKLVKYLECSWIN